MAKSFFITQYGNVDLVLACLKNIDEGVMLSACKALQVLLAAEEGAQDLFVRHKGIQTLRDCANDYK